MDLDLVQHNVLLYLTELFGFSFVNSVILIIFKNLFYCDRSFPITILLHDVKYYKSSLAVSVLLFVSGHSVLKFIIAHQKVWSWAEQLFLKKMSEKSLTNYL